MSDILKAARVESGVFYVTFTKAVARQLLANSSCNRPVRKVLAEKYRRVMDAGEWGTSDTCILVSSLSQLLGGQHRLTAFVSSSLERIELPVKFNALESDRRDQNLSAAPASQADRIKMFYPDLPPLRDFRWAKAVAPFIALASGAEGQYSSQSLSEGQVARLIREWRNAMLAGEEHLSGKYATYAPISAAFLFAHPTMDKKRWVASAKKLSTGLGLVTGDPIAALRRAYENRESVYGRGQSKLRLDQFRKALTALQAVEQGHSVTKLQPQDSAILYWRNRYQALERAEHVK